MPPLQRLALIAYLTVVVLIFVGAIVRATGSGLGCPDWPFCYGRVVPPTSAEQIDFQHLNLERFRKKAAQHGRDPASITPETIRAEFNPVHTWIEYLNRLSSTPVALSALLLVIASRRHKQVFRAACMAGLLILVNAWLGAKVVFSGLQPGIITLHMALAILLLCVLVYAAWRAHPQPWSISVASSTVKLAYVLFGLVILEGILGSQVRELTDALAHTHAGEPRSAWVTELESTWTYLIHRSASWMILGMAIVFGLRTRLPLERTIVALVFAQMLLGVILAHVGIVPTAQVLHIGLSSLLVSGLFLWLLGARSTTTSSHA